MVLFKNAHLIMTFLFVILLSACGESQDQQANANHLTRAKAYQEQGQYKAATIEYKNAVKKTKGDTTAISQYADMLNRLGHYASALGLLEQAQGDKDEAYYIELVETYQGLQKYQSAQKTLDQQLNGDSVVVKRLIADNYLGLSELSVAEGLYQELLNADAADDKALLGKATALVRGNKIEQSLELLNGIGLGSDAYVKSRILMAGIHINQAKLELAESILSDLLSKLSNTDIIEPDKALVLERLSYVLTRQGRSNEAYIYTKLLAEAFPGSNKVKEQYQLAVEKLQSGELEASQAVLLDILGEYPSYNRATQLLGVISYLRGDNASASKYLSDSVDPEVANEMTKHIYAATNLKLNEPKKVLEILEPTISKSKIPATLALYGLAAISDKQYSKGENALLKALEIDKDNVRVRLALAGFYRNSSTPDETKEWEQLSLSYETAPDDKQVLKDIVSYHLRHKGVEKANEFINQALSKNGAGYAINLVAGYFALNQNKVKSALKYFTAATKAKADGDDHLNALFAKGKAEITMKKLDDAKKTFDELIRVFPESELGYKGLLSVYLITGDEALGQEKLVDYADRNAQIAPYLVLIQSAVAQQDVSAANKYHKLAVSLKAEDPVLESLGNAIRYVEAVLAMKTGNFPEARSIVASILSSEPDNIRLLSFLVDLELKAGKVNEASKILGQIENINQHHPVVALLKGDLAIANKDLKEAKVQFTYAWKNNPSETAADKLFKVLSYMQDQTGQNQHVSDWLAAFPNSVTAILYQAINYQQRGQRIKAVEGYERLLQLTPNNVMALNNLGWIYFEKEDNRALGLLKQAVDLSPESAAVLDSYGWVLAQSGKVKEGLVYLEKANKLAPEIKEISEHLKKAQAL